MTYRRLADPQLIAAIIACCVCICASNRATARRALAASSVCGGEAHCDRLQVPKTALQAPFRGGTLQPVAQQVVRLAADGLRRRGRGEEKYLDPLIEIADSGVTLAERTLALYHGAWGGKLDPLYDGSFDY